MCTNKATTRSIPILQAQRQAFADVAARLTASWFCGTLIVILSVWVLHSFLQALLAACVVATVSWPLYIRFKAVLPRCISETGGALIFTLLITLFAFGPLVFAFGALLTEAHTL